MRKVCLHKVKDDLSRYLRDAEKEVIVLTRHAEPVGVLIGFSSEEDWFEYRLERDSGFFRRIAKHGAVALLERASSSVSGCCPRTVEVYCYWLGPLIRPVPDTASLDSMVVMRFFAGLRKRGLSASTLHQASVVFCGSRVCPGEIVERTGVSVLA